MSRKTYQVTVVVLIQMDDEFLPEVQRKVQESANDWYHRMERDDIRVALQQTCEVKDLG